MAKANQRGATGPNRSRGVERPTAVSVKFAANGGLVEYHYAAVKVCEAIYGPLPAPVDGWLELPEVPGLGFQPRQELIKELKKNPTSHGKGKA